MLPSSPTGESISPLGRFSKSSSDYKHSSSFPNDANLPRYRRWSGDATYSCDKSSANSPLEVSRDDSYCTLKQRSMAHQSVCHGHDTRTRWFRHTVAERGHPVSRCCDTKLTVTQSSENNSPACELPDSTCGSKRPHYASTRRRLRTMGHRCCTCQSCENKQGDAAVFSWSLHSLLEHLRSSLSLVLRGTKLSPNVASSWEALDTSKSVLSSQNSNALMMELPSGSALRSPFRTSLPSSGDLGAREELHPEGVWGDGRSLEAGSSSATINGPGTPECIYSPVLGPNSKNLNHPNSRKTRDCESNISDATFPPKINSEKNSVSLDGTAFALPTSHSSTNISRLPRKDRESLRRPSYSWRSVRWSPTWTVFLPLLLLLFASSLPNLAEACSSRSTPRPRPQNTTLRPNITFQTYACPPAYAAWYCLNGATCFTVKISESILYNCECADGYMGQRCEYKDLDGSYLPAGGKVLLETASIAGGAALIILLVFFGIFSIFVLKNKERERELDGVPRINININNSWPGPPGTNTPVRYYEHHTITTSTPSHISAPLKSPHPLHHSVTMPSDPSFSTHSLVSVDGKTLPSGRGDGLWGPPDRVIKTVTTITDLASIYSGRKQAIHRVEVVQEVDEVREDKPRIPCVATAAWGNPSPMGKSPCTAVVPPSWPNLEAPPPLTIRQAAEVEKIFPSQNNNSFNYQKLVVNEGDTDCEVSVEAPPVEDSAREHSTLQCGESLQESRCSETSSSFSRCNSPGVSQEASSFFMVDARPQVPLACVHSNQSSNSNADEQSRADLCKSPILNQVSCPISSPSQRPASRPDLNASSNSPRTSNPNFNSNLNSSVNAGAYNIAYTHDDV